jgi:hypothetical protein
VAGIGGGLAQVQALRVATFGSLGAIEDELASIGYEPDPQFISPVGDGRYRATAWGGENGRYRAQAIGSTPVGAAQSLVRTLQRR